jgi:hypothetical protein
VSVVAIGIDTAREEQRATEVIVAVKQFNAKYKHYPVKPQEIVPEFMPDIPRPRMAAAAGNFMYWGGPDPTLFYVVLPPYGRNTYHFTTGRRGYID